MKNYKYQFFIFIASIVVGFLVVINFGIGKTTGIFSMNASEYKDATEERNDLLKTISDLKENNDELSKRIDSYLEGENGSERVVEDMKSQLKDYTPLSGNAQVSGPGIILTIDDANYSISENTQHEITRSIFHNSDVALVINELRSAGAEAIAMNSYRILSNTGVECAWAFVIFNQDIMESAPFKFYAIGDPDYLEEAILSEGSHINKLKIRKLKVEIEKVDDMVLPAAAKISEPEFMERNES